MPSSAQPPVNSPAPDPRWRQAVRLLRPSHSHSAFTATVLLMAAAMLSRVIGLVRVKYIAWLLGTGSAADAFNAAFMLPDKLQYFLVGGATSIIFITMLNRYRSDGREAEGERVMSIILSTMLVVLGTAIVIAEFAAPAYVHLVLHGFARDPGKAALCVRLTRILLPAQLCFLAGGVFSAVLLVRKQFALQAVTPLIYNVGIIAGGLLLARHLGASALALGAVAGAFLGPFLLNAIWAHRAGMRFRFEIDLRNPGLREWVGLSLPLMLGVSLVTADSWIINYFASGTNGAVTLLTYAKQFFNAPVALGQAAGAASLPFLASLFTERNVPAFSNAVNRAVSRILAFSLLLTGFMLAMGFPLLDLILRGGKFQRADSHAMALYFSVFSVSLCLWAAQAIYARAFYAAGNTLLPMIAGTAVTLASLPVYWWLYHSMGPLGLPIASDIGILLQTLALAVLLHKKRMVSIAELEYGELGRAMAASAVALLVLLGLRRVIPSHSRLEELGLLGLATVVWLGVGLLVLRLTGSALPDQLLRRFRRSAA
jgi:putative peptidoglycan lipid II flippase